MVGNNYIVPRRRSSPSISRRFPQNSYTRVRLPPPPAPEPPMNTCSTFLSGDVQSMFSGNLSLNSNSDISQVSGYDGMTGNLSVHSGVSSLAGLESLRYIGGNLIISSPSLTALSGLDNLTTVGGDLVANSNVDNIASFAALDNLHSVGGNLDIESCAVVSLAGAFPCLESCGSIDINSLDFLTTIAGAFPHLTTLRYLDLEFCSALTTMSGAFPLWSGFALDGPTSFITIAFCPNMSNMSGSFSALTVIPTVTVRNTGLPNLSFPSLATTSSLTVKNNPLLTTLATFAACTSLTNCDVENNSILSTVAGLLNIDGSQYDPIIPGPTARSFVFFGNPSLPTNAQVAALSTHLTSTGYAGSFTNTSNGAG